MKTKLFLILTFTLFSNLLSAQLKYPIQTIFKGDSVVIITKNQAIDINKSIDLKNLSIKNYEKSIWNLKDTVGKLRWNLITKEAELQRKIEKVRDTLTFTSNSLMVANKEIEFYKEQMKRIEKLEYIDKRTRRRVAIGIGGALVTWWTIIILNLIDSK